MLRIVSGCKFHTLQVVWSVAQCSGLSLAASFIRYMLCGVYCCAQDCLWLQVSYFTGCVVCSTMLRIVWLQVSYFTGCVVCSTMLRIVWLQVSYFTGCVVFVWSVLLCSGLSVAARFAEGKTRVYFLC